MADQTIKRNDLLPSITIVCRDGIGPVDLFGYTATFTMVNVLTGQPKISNVAATVQTDPTFTADASTNILTANGHELIDGEDVTLKTTNTLPGGLVTQKRYYAVNATTNTLQLATQPGGAAIDITSAGTGTHTLLTGKVRYDWQGTDKDTAGTFFQEVTTTIGGKSLTYANDRHLVVEVISDLA